MCWELEVIGLPDPSYNNDTFILKTTVKSFLIKKLPIDDRETRRLGPNRRKERRLETKTRGSAIKTRGLVNKTRGLVNKTRGLKEKRED